MTSDPVAAPAPNEDVEAVPARRASARRNLVLFLAAVVVLDIVAFVLVPPYPAGQPGHSISGISDLITANLELPAPNVVLDLAPDSAPPPSAILSFHPSITNTIFTTWCVMIAGPAHRVLRDPPAELDPRALSEPARVRLGVARELWGSRWAARRPQPYIPLFAAFFLLILFCNWSGLIPPVGKIEELRAPTSDVNITLGLALVSFGYFEFQGFRKHGVRGYLGRFFPIYEFRNGIGAGIIAMFVGLIELMLEFVKPVTLSMRLFGNIYGGEVALAAITALTLAFIPVALLGLEVMLNFIQALIFSILSLMFIVLAIESHGDEEARRRRWRRRWILPTRPARRLAQPIDDPLSRQQPPSAQ